MGRAWLGVLALLSLAFYASWNPWYCAPLLLTAAVLLADAPLSPLRTGRQPAPTDREPPMPESS